MDWSALLRQKIKQKVSYESTEYFKGEPTSPPKSEAKFIREKYNDYQCKICLKQLSSKATLKQHQRYFHLNEKYQCEYCRKKFRTLYSVKKCNDLCRHKSELSFEKKGSKFVEKFYHNCDICSQKFVSEWNCLIHKQIVHDKKDVHKCKICTKVFGSEGALKIHLQRIHDCDDFQIKKELNFCRQQSRIM